MYRYYVFMYIYCTHACIDGWLHWLGSSMILTLPDRPDMEMDTDCGDTPTKTIRGRRKRRQRLTHKGLQLVVNAAGLAHIPGGRLQGDGGRAVGRHLEVEGMGVRAELFDQTLLQTGHWSLQLHGRIDLLMRQIQILAECQAQDVEVLASIAKGGQNLAEHLAILDILRVDEHHSVDGIHMRDMVDKVTLPQVHSDLAVGGALLEDARRLPAGAGIAASLVAGGVPGSCHICAGAIAARCCSSTSAVATATVSPISCTTSPASSSSTTVRAGAECVHWWLCVAPEASASAVAILSPLLWCLSAPHSALCFLDSSRRFINICVRCGAVLQFNFLCVYLFRYLPTPTGR